MKSLNTDVNQARGRPDLYLDAHKWADHRDVPTLLIRTSSSVGLTKEHVDQLKAFAEHCRSVHRNP